MKMAATEVRADFGDVHPSFSDLLTPHVKGETGFTSKK